MAKIELPQLNECRPEVIRMARVMEYKLRLNDHKGGWKNGMPLWFLTRLAEEVGELSKAVRTCPHNDPRVHFEAADVANFAMMVADIMYPIIGEVEDRG